MGIGIPIATYFCSFIPISVQTDFGFIPISLRETDLFRNSFGKFGYPRMGEN
ncbi:hypothetical protein ACFYKX_11855 [Cytobacillus sp. FJAT-54145]|uniref:Uncharacterized protein n=1 Tax=Cytobacillus spartinae TaxID=3299023 RepID=A0ABW6KE22_9BACI